MSYLHIIIGETIDYRSKSEKKIFVYLDTSVHRKKKFNSLLVQI